MSKFSFQETPVRQISCRMIFNVTTAGATKPNGSKTEAIKDKSKLPQGETGFLSKGIHIELQEKFVFLYIPKNA